MFVVTEAEAAAIQVAFDQGGEFAAAVELRWYFRGITNAQAREHARMIASSKPLHLPLPTIWAVTVGQEPSFGED